MPGLLDPLSVSPPCKHTQPPILLVSLAGLLFYSSFYALVFYIMSVLSQYLSRGPIPDPPEDVVTAPAAQTPPPRLVLIMVSVLAENLNGDAMGTGTTPPVPPPRGEVSERSAEVVDELVALRLCDDEATAAAAEKTGTTSTPPPLAAVVTS